MTEDYLCVVDLTKAMMGSVVNIHAPKNENKYPAGMTNIRIFYKKTSI